MTERTITILDRYGRDASDDTMTGFVGAYRELATASGDMEEYAAVLLQDSAGWCLTVTIESILLENVEPGGCSFGFHLVRDSEAAADAARLFLAGDFEHLTKLFFAYPPTITVEPDGDRWFATIPDSFFASEGLTEEDAVADLVANLREYAEEWPTHYRQAPNHADQESLVGTIQLLEEDEALVRWLSHR